MRALMIAVDTNIIVYLHIQGDKTFDVEKLFWQTPIGSLQCYGAMSLLTCFLYLQPKRKVRNSRVYSNFDDASRTLGQNTFTIPPIRIVQTANKTSCSGYDSQFVALAEDLDLDLYTYDQKILKSCAYIAKMPPSVTK